MAETYNLATEYKPLLDKRFSQKSLTEAWCGHDYDWNGVNTIGVWTINGVDLHTYSKTGMNRFTGGNALTNIGDELNTYSLRNDASFSTVIEGYQNADQKSIKKANAILKQVWDEQIVPEQDMYRLKTWANGAGQVVVDSEALTADNVIRRILVGQAGLNNKLVGRDSRVCFMSESAAVETKLASQLTYNRDFTTKALVNGEVTRMGGLPIVAVPDHYMPEGVDFMIKWKRASADPQKLKLLRVLNQVQGIYGPVLEGLVRYDSFVLANKADGIYVHCHSGACAPVTASLSSGKIALACETSGSTIYYTENGQNPKTAGAAAKVYSDPITVTPGATLRAYAAADGYMNSGILTIKEEAVQ